MESKVISQAGPARAPQPQLLLAPGRKMLMVGFGAIGQGCIDLLLNSGAVKSQQLTVLTGDDRGQDIADKYQVRFDVEALTSDNYGSVLAKYGLKAGDVLVNLSVNVSSADLIKWCMEQRVAYVDSASESWQCGSDNESVPMEQRTNYAAREELLALKANMPSDAPTVIITHGANPGLVNHFVKQALVNVAKDEGKLSSGIPTCQAEWAALARDLGVKTIHISERDSQVPTSPKKAGEFVNTWSVDGFVEECLQPSEFGYGTHEKYMPRDGRRFEFGCKSAIYLQRPSLSVRIRSWTPNEGPFHGLLLTHSECISIANYLEVKDQQDNTVSYRPTVQYAYHPCDEAMASVYELHGKNFRRPPKQRVIREEILRGADELGVLLMGDFSNGNKGYWFGSYLDIGEARRLVPYNNATSLQVVAGVYSAIVYAIENDGLGLVEPDELDFEAILNLSKPFLGRLYGTYTSWTPLQDRNLLFPEVTDEDPWQFLNFRVA